MSKELDFKTALAEKKARVKEDLSSLTRRAEFIIDEYQEGRLVVGADGEGESVYCIDRNNVIRPVSERALIRIVFNFFNTLKSKDRKEVADFVKLALSERAVLDLSTVAVVAFADEGDTLTWNRLPLKRSDLLNVTLKDVPEFANLLKFCDDPKALVLFIGSLLDPAASRVQYLHLHGTGGNGKSRLFEGIESVLGSRFVARTNSQTFGGTHWGEEVEGKRLLLFAEDNNPGFFSTSKFKEFTGEAVATVNPKKEKTRAIRLTHKTVVISNNQVEISTNVADRRRLLSVSVKPNPDDNHRHTWWYAGMVSNAAKMLAYCLREYEEAIALDPTIRSSIPQSSEAAEGAISRKYSEITDVILKNYEITLDKENTLDRADVHAQLARELGERQQNRVFMQALREALTRLGAEEGKRHGGISVYRGIKDGPAKPKKELKRLT